MLANVARVAAAIAAALVLAAVQPARCPRADLPGPAASLLRSIPGRRQHRRGGAGDAAGAGENSGPGGGGREQGRRRRHAGRRCDRQGRARRLHVRDRRRRRAGREHRRAREAALRSGQGYRARQQGRDIAFHPGGDAGAERPFGCRRNQARQGRTRPAVDRPRRQWHRDASRRADIRHHGRREDQSGALSRHRARGHRHDCRSRPARHRRSAAVDGRHQRRQAQGTGRLVVEAVFGVSRRADPRRTGLEKFRGHRLVRHRRAVIHPARDRDEAQRRGGCGAEGSRGRPAHPHDWHGADATTPEEFAAFIDSEIVKAAKVPVPPAKPD